MKVFNNYAGYYDTLYSDKDYKKECDFLEKLISKYSKIDVKTVLDLGCGTGGHSILLAKRSYKVCGIDLSPKMLKIAVAKAKNEGISVKYSCADIRNINLKKKFDSVICMFAVIGYQNKNKDLEDTFNTVRKHLKKGGLFVFDFWFGPAVLSIKPVRRIKKIKKAGKEIIRQVTPELDIMNNIVTTHYTVIDKAKPGNVIKESHKMRYLFPKELEYYALKNGLETIRFCGFLKLDEKPSVRTWNVTGIMRNER